MNPGRVIHAWNTGCAYSAKGQRIAATLVNVDGLPYWIFEDADRHISGAAIAHISETRTGDKSQARAEVMNAYLNNSSWESLCYVADVFRRTRCQLLSDLRPELIAACDALPASEQIAR